MAEPSSDEVKKEEIVYKFLEKNEIYPTNVTYTYEYNGILSISFFMEENLDEFLEVIKYKHKCDKTGYEIFRDNKTILLRGSAIIDCLWKIERY